MRVLDLLKSATQYLEKSGVSDAVADAELLVLHAAGLDRMTAYRDNPEVGEQAQVEMLELLKRRAAGEPVQYIVGSVDFLGLRIEAGRGVLIPRPETELVALQAMREMRSLLQASPARGRTSLRILDLCCGSGCISLALGREFACSSVTGTDISGTAIRYSTRNAEINGITNVSFLEGSLYEPIARLPLFDMLISNPPYIATSELDELQREIREWEPLNALDGGPDGLDFYRKIFSGAKEYLNKRGVVVLELGFGQGSGVREIAEKAGFENIAIGKDLAGIERILTAETASAS